MKQVADVTLILNVWKRNYLDDQLESIAKQTCLPKHIWIIRYEHHTDMRSILNKYKNCFPSINCIESEKNLKYFARFSFASFAETKYTWVLDDDVIPSPPWMEIAINKCNEHNALICCTGRIIPPDDFEPEKPKLTPDDFFYGDEPATWPYNTCAKDTVVDFGCNSYFFRSEWIKYFWMIWPRTFKSGEDIHFAATLKILAGINTIVPEQQTLRDTGNMRKSYGADEHSSWLKPGFFEIRRDILKYLILEKKWKPLLWGTLIQK
jgi:hypothetical protein